MSWFSGSCNKIKQILIYFHFWNLSRGRKKVLSFLKILNIRSIHWRISSIRASTSTIRLKLRQRRLSSSKLQCSWFPNLVAYSVLMQPFSSFGSGFWAQSCKYALTFFYFNKMDLILLLTLKIVEPSNNQRKGQKSSTCWVRNW